MEPVPLGAGTANGNACCLQQDTPQLVQLMDIPSLDSLLKLQPNGILKQKNTSEPFGCFRQKIPADKRSTPFCTPIYLTRPNK